MKQAMLILSISIAGANRRITIFDAQMTVIIDSHDDVVGTNKADRPELKDIGSIATRKSKTIDQPLHYIAGYATNDRILRVAIQAKPSLAYYQETLMVLLVVGLITSLASYGYHRYQNQVLLQHFTRINDALFNPMTEQYKRLPTQTGETIIDQLSQQINHKQIAIESVWRQEKQEKKYLLRSLNEMRQAVILLDDRAAVLYYNEDAKKIFALKQKLTIKQWVRDQKFIQALAKIHVKKQSVIDIRRNHRIYEIRLFALDAKADMSNRILIVGKDVTHMRSAEQMKRDFFAYASHELKTPLTTIRGYAELIEHQIVAESEYKEVAEKIVKKVDTTNALVEDMLMLARLESLEDRQDRVIEIEAVLLEVINEFQAMLETKQLRLTTETSKFFLRCDRLDIHKLFKNLLENAIRYSEKNKQIHMILARRKDKIFFSIKDQGVGIPSSEVKRVFERFYRVENQTGSKGTGLGLAIVKHVVIKYGGAITIDSVLGEGTTISFSLPTTLEKAV